jgi:hypothetical protein
VQYKFPSLNYALGKTGTDNIGNSVAPTGKPFSSIDLTADWTVELAGEWLLVSLSPLADFPC